MIDYQRQHRNTFCGWSTMTGIHSLKVGKTKLNTPEQYLGKPKVPHYKTKDEEMLLVFTNPQLCRKEKTIHFPEQLHCTLPTLVPLSTLLTCARIIPKGSRYIVEIIYIVGVLQKSLVIQCMTDFDVDIENFRTMIHTIDERPIVMKGKDIMALNQWYNKHLAKLKNLYTQIGVN